MFSEKSFIIYKLFVLKKLVLNKLFVLICIVFETNQFAEFVQNKNKYTKKS